MNSSDKQFPTKPQNCFIFPSEFQMQKPRISTNKTTLIKTTLTVRHFVHHTVLPMLTLPCQRLQHLRRQQV